MAKVTWPYIEAQFYQRFAQLPRPEQHGIITGLRAVMLCESSEEPSVQAELFPEDEDAPQQ